MKVDMSPKAVTARLKTLDELWILSVKLMNSKKAATVKKQFDENAEMKISQDSDESLDEK